MGTRLDQTRKGRLRENSFDPDLTNRADTYFDRGGCSTVIRSSLYIPSGPPVSPCQRESDAANHLLGVAYYRKFTLFMIASCRWVIYFWCSQQVQEIPRLCSDTCWPKASVRFRSANVNILFLPLLLPDFILSMAQDEMGLTINGPARHKLGYQSTRQPDTLP